MTTSPMTFVSTRGFKRLTVGGNTNGFCTLFKKTKLRLTSFTVSDYETSLFVVVISFLSFIFVVYFNS